MMIAYYRVSTPRATFTIKVKDGIVVDAPPIARKSIGRFVKRVLQYYANDWGAKITRLKVE